MRGLSPLAWLLVSLLAAALVTRPLLHGVAAPTLLAFGAVVLGQVVLPGVLLARGAGLVSPGDQALLLGQGTTLGLAIQGLALLCGRALGLPWLVTLAALAAAAAGLALSRRPAARPPAFSRPAPSSGAQAATLAIALGGVLLLPLASAARVAEPMPFDLLFHGGVAAELRHRWPLQDPRVAGVPLHYHLLAYALPVATADLSGAPVADPLFTLAPLFWIALFALQLGNAGRAFFGDLRAGAWAAAVVLFHADPGRLLGLGPGAFNSFLPTGIYGSPTTLCGFALLLGLALSIHSWLERGEPRELVALGLLAAAASAAKTTVLPVAAGALALAALAAGARRQTTDARRLVQALAVTVLFGAPFTLWQTAGAETYSAMAGIGLAGVFTRSGFALALRHAFGPGATHGLAALPSFALWLLGYLGLSGVAAASWLAGRRHSLSTAQGWALAVVVVGLGASLIVEVPDLSQLFLLYNGQLMLALFAGAALAGAVRRPPGARALLLLAVLALAALPSLDQLWRALPAAARQDVAAAEYQPPLLERDYALGLRWLRSHASRDAVVWADNPSLLLSALGEVRLYYENGLYTARGRRVGPGREAWPERAALQTRLLRRPDRAVIDEARRAIGTGPRLLIVADAVQSSVAAGFVRVSIGAVPRRRLFPRELFELRFVNSAMQVYEARE